MYKHFFMYEKFKSQEPFDGHSYYITLFYIIRFRLTILYNVNIFKVDIGVRIMDGELSFGGTMIAKE